MNRLLFILNVSLAVLLLALVLGCPLLGLDPRQTDGWQRVVSLFAEDVTVRRTAIASAIGLFVTAVIFYRRTDAPAKPRKPRQPAPPPPPRVVAGA